MSGSVFGSVNEYIGHALPERRVYVRSDTRTRYFTVSPVSQCGLALMLAAGIGWTGFTSWTFIDKAMDGRTAESRIEATEHAYETQLAAMREQQRLLEEELNRSNARGDVVTRELSEKQRLLVGTATRYRVAEAELSGLRSELETLTSRRREEQARAAALEEEITGLRMALAEAAQRDTTMDKTLAAFSHSMARVIEDRDEAAARADEFDTRVAALESELADARARQETLIARLEEATNTSLAALNDIFVGAEIDVEDILRQTKRDFTGQGGVFDPLLEDRRSAAEPVEEERVAALMGNLERVSLMRVAVDRLPFGMPTQGARMTSGFGKRSDPFHRRAANHEGIDFAAPTGTPIYSTAEGVVTFSGRQSGYGIVVKIRHAFGFETVYAHLSKSRVRVGQRVTRGMRIADMGSTGRSTGSHLHYEVRIDGQPVNPSEFIRVARHVL